MKYSIVAVLLVLAVLPLDAGQLADFEADATSYRAPVSWTAPRGHSYHHRRHYNMVWDEIAWESLQLVGAGMVYGGIYSWERVRAIDSQNAISTGLVAREPGELLIPYAAFDLTFQYLDHDINAWQLDAEIGHGPIALAVSKTYATDSEPEEQLDLTQIYGLYRMSLGNRLEIDIAMGGWMLQGEGLHTGPAWGLPIRYCPSENFAVEFKPMAGDINGTTTREYDLSLLAGKNFVSFRAGYRWLWSPEESLHGPYAGISIRY